MIIMSAISHQLVGKPQNPSDGCPPNFLGLYVHIAAHGAGTGFYSISICDYKEDLEPKCCYHHTGKLSKPQNLLPHCFLCRHHLDHLSAFSHLLWWMRFGQQLGIQAEHDHLPAYIFINSYNGTYLSDHLESAIIDHQLICQGCPSPTPHFFRKNAFFAHDLGRRKIFPG